MRLRFYGSHSAHRVVCYMAFLEFLLVNIWFILHAKFHNIASNTTTLASLIGADWHARYVWLISFKCYLDVLTGCNVYRCAVIINHYHRNIITSNITPRGVRMNNSVLFWSIIINGAHSVLAWYPMYQLTPFKRITLADSAVMDTAMHIRLSTCNWFFLQGLLLRVNRVAPVCWSTFKFVIWMIIGL